MEAVLWPSSFSNHARRYLEGGLYTKDARLSPADAAKLMARCRDPAEVDELLFCPLLNGGANHGVNPDGNDDFIAGENATEDRWWVL